MKRIAGNALGVCAALIVAASSVWAGWPGDPAKCRPDQVKAGATCIDRYEASVWLVPSPTTTNKPLVNAIVKGTVTLADLTAAGATQLGCTAAPFSLTAYPGNFPADGNWTPLVGSNPPTPGVYAASIPGVLPSTCITWFQAEQACALANKRLPRNQEWQRAAASTPDPGTDNRTTDCAVSSGVPVNTGSRSSCVSAWGAYDMVGNAREFVGDWVDVANNCTDWTTQTGIAGGDDSCFGGEGTPSGAGTNMNIPGAPYRGGYWNDGAAAGVFAVRALRDPFSSWVNAGFRCAR